MVDVLNLFSIQHVFNNSVVLKYGDCLDKILLENVYQLHSLRTLAPKLDD